MKTFLSIVGLGLMVSQISHADKLIFRGVDSVTGEVCTLKIDERESSSLSEYRADVTSSYKLDGQSAQTIQAQFTSEKILSGSDAATGQSIEINAKYNPYEPLRVGTFTWSSGNDEAASKKTCIKTSLVFWQITI